MRMLEAQAELTRIEESRKLEEEELALQAKALDRAAKREEEELALQAKALALKRKHHEQHTAAKLNNDRLQLEYETRSEVGGSSRSNLSVS